MNHQPLAKRLMFRTVKSFKKGSFFYKLLMILLLSTVLFSLINLGTMIYINRTMLERETRTQIAYMDYSINLINDSMAGIYNTINRLAIDTDMAGALDSYNRLSRDYYEITGFRKIFNKLSAVRLDGNKYLDLFIYVDRDAYIVTDEGVIDSDLYFQLRFANQAGIWQTMMQERNRMRIEPMDIYFNNKAQNTVCLMNSLYYNMRKLGTLVVAVDPASLCSQSLYADFTRDRLVCLMNDDGQVVAHLSGHDDTVFALAPKLTGDQPVALQKDGYLIRMDRTSASGLYMLVMTPMSQITGSVSPIFNLTAWIIGAAFIVGVLLSLLLSQQIYKPVLRLLDLLRDSGTAAATSLPSEFVIIERNVASILKNYEHMERAVVDSMPLLLEAVFKKTIAGDQDWAALAPLLRELSLEFREGLYLTVVIRAQRLRPAGRQDLDYVLLSQLDELARAYLGENVISLFRMADDILAVILFLPAADKMPAVAQYCADLHARILVEQDPVSCRIGVGTPYPDPYAAGQSYREALQALEDYRVGGSQSVLIYDSASRNESAPGEPIIPNDLENKLHQYMLSGNGRLATDLVRDTLKHNYGLGITLAAYQRLLVALQGFARRVYDALDAGGRKKVAFQDFIPEDEPDIDRAQCFILTNYRALADYYGACGSVDLIERIVQYIDENLQHDIGLEEIADKVGLTPNYITRYFHKQKGVNFKAYINAKRIEKAKALLADTRLTVKDIAARCGYNSSKRFITTFTKYIGSTPTVYRRRKLLLEAGEPEQDSRIA